MLLLTAKSANIIPLLSRKRATSYHINYASLNAHVSISGQPATHFKNSRFDKDHIYIGAGETIQSCHTLNLCLIVVRPTSHFTFKQKLWIVCIQMFVYTIYRDSFIFINTDGLQN